MEPPADRSSVAARPAAPTGLVTFVFTDGEGSTRLLRELGEAYVDLLDHHHRVLRAAWRRHEGYEFFTEGDAFGVAFASIDQALAACLDAQWHLQNESWPNGARMPVRMGVHTGLAAPRNGDYIALAVHQTSRVVAAAHGDQIVVTGDALASAGREFLASARDLGTYRVRDFDEPVRLHQLSVPGLPDGFSTLRVPPARLHNLSRPAASFVGRTSELDRLEQLVEPGRIVSVVGPGGVGKTRLCTEFALSAVDRWPDGVWFVDLAALDQGDQVVPATAAALGLSSSDTDTREAILEHLSTHAALLVFDNAEHVLEPTGVFVAAIAGRASSSASLITSREPLGLRGERVVRLDPLSEHDATRLFIERADDVLGSFSSDLAAIDPDLHRLRELCGRLDHLPLALEMAAARTGVLGVDELLHLLDTRASRLSSTDPSLEQRQRSLDELVGWSVQLLNEPERDVLRRASLFAASFTSGSLGALLDPASISTSVDDALYELAVKSLLVTDTSGGERRFRLLETVRAHLRSQRTIVDERRDASALGHWMVEHLGPATPRDHRWSSTAALELANLRHTARLLADDDPELAARLMNIVATFHDLSGSVTVGIEELQQFDALIDDNSPARVSVLIDLAWLYLTSDRIDLAAAALAEGNRLRSVADQPAANDIALDLTNADLMVRSGKPAEALTSLAPLVDDELPTFPLRLQLWTTVAMARFDLGEIDGAAQAFALVVRLAEEHGSTAILSIALSNLADALLALGDFVGAAQTQLASLQADEQLGVTRTLPFSMMLAALVAAETQRWDDALWLQTRANHLIDQEARVLYPADRARADALVDRATAELGAGLTESITCDAGTTAVDVMVDRAKSVLTHAATQRTTQGEHQ